MQKLKQNLTNETKKLLGVTSFQETTLDKVRWPEYRSRKLLGSKRVKILVRLVGLA